jgi:hypothetical protein
MLFCLNVWTTNVRKSMVTYFVRVHQVLLGAIFEVNSEDEPDTSTGKVTVKLSCFADTDNPEGDRLADGFSQLGVGQMAYFSNLGEITILDRSIANLRNQLSSPMTVTLPNQLVYTTLASARDVALSNLAN